MKYLFLFILTGWFSANAAAKPLQDFDKTAFYAAYASGSVERIDNELSVVRSASFAEKDAYEGALLMRKAGLLKSALEKLKAFKAGRIKFDPAIQADPNNVEYHFLRLTIQENAPRVVKYFKEQEADKEVIITGFKNLSPVVQNAIRDYAKTSKLLRAEEL